MFEDAKINLIKRENKFILETETTSKEKFFESDSFDAKIVYHLQITWNLNRCFYLESNTNTFVLFYKCEMNVQWNIIATTHNSSVQYNYDGFTLSPSHHSWSCLL